MTVLRYHDCLVLLALLALVSGCQTASEESKVDAAEKVIEVETASAVRRDVEIVVSAMGRTEAAPEKLAILTAAIEGHVHKIAVTPGTVVSAGDTLIEFDTSVAAADLAEKTATKEAAQAALDLLTTPPRAEDRRPLELAVKQAEVGLQRAEEFATRIKNLAAKNEASSAQLFDAEKAVEQADLQRKTSQAQLDALVAGPRPQAIDEARSKLKAATEAVALAQAHLDLCTVRAPIGGVIDTLNCHLGQTVSPGTMLGELIDAQQLIVVAYVPPLSAHKVKAGQPVNVLVNGGGKENEDNSPRKLQGKVEFVSAVADPQTGSQAIRISVDNQDGSLALGQMVNLGIVVNIEKGMICVPTAAVVDLGDGPVITIVDDGKTKLLRPASLINDSSWSAVEGASVEEGAPIVISGQFNLPEGTAVTIKQESAPQHE